MSLPFTPSRRGSSDNTHATHCITQEATQSNAIEHAKFRRDGMVLHPWNSSLPSRAACLGESRSTVVVRNVKRCLIPEPQPARQKQPIGVFFFLVIIHKHILSIRSASALDGDGRWRPRLSLKSRPPGCARRQQALARSIPTNTCIYESRLPVPIANEILRQSPDAVQHPPLLLLVTVAAKHTISDPACTREPAICVRSRRV